DRAPAVDLHQALSLQHLLARDRQRDRHGRARRRSCRDIYAHGFAGAAAGDGSVFGGCLISVRLGPFVKSCPSPRRVITVSGLVATCVFIPLCTRGVPRNSTLPSPVV